MGSQNSHSNKRKISGPPHGFWMSVSDLMAGLIFIFLIILTVFSIQFKKEQNEFIKAKAELQAPAITRQHILVALRKMISKEDLQVEILPEDGILRLTETTLSFPSARAVPDEEKLPNLGKVARALTSILPCFSKAEPPSLQQGADPSWCQATAKQEKYQCPKNLSGSIESIMIEGHTDATIVRASAGYLDNLSLSAARATTVLRLLKMCDPQLGLLFNKKDEPLVGASGYSSLRPIIKENPKDPKNRRIDIRFVMDLPENALENKTKFAIKQL